MDKQLTTEQLLQPRYKVIADYPNSAYRVGSLITNLKYWAKSNLGLAPGQVDKYPHLFKKLEWWEERDQSEMPKYVKSLINQEFYKVIQFNEVSFRGTAKSPDKFGIDYPWSNAIPITEEEYNNQKL